MFAYYIPWNKAENLKHKIFVVIILVKIQQIHIFSFWPIGSTTTQLCAMYISVYLDLIKIQLFLSLLMLLAYLFKNYVGDF